MNEDNRRYLAAKRRVRNLRNFYMNLFSYIVISAFLAILNLITSPDSLWFYWPMLGWGIGVLFHGFSTFTSFGLDEDWEERKIQKILNKDQQ